jgi:hypothetical protein
MKQQTALEWLIEQLIPKAFAIYDITTCNAIEKAKQMEKEQIKRAFEFGVADAYNYNDDEGEEYYNQTYENTNGTSIS